MTLPKELKEAAEKAKAPSKADYLKSLVAEWVASDLGVPVSQLLETQTDLGKTQQEAAIAVARLEQTIADANASLQALRKQAAPRRTQSGTMRKVG